MRHAEAVSSPVVAVVEEEETSKREDTSKRRTSVGVYSHPCQLWAGVVTPARPYWMDIIHLPLVLLVLFLLLLLLLLLYFLVSSTAGVAVRRAETVSSPVAAVLEKETG